MEKKIFLFLVCLFSVLLVEEDIFRRPALADSTVRSVEGGELPQATEFFSEEEITTWKNYRQQKRMFRLISAGSILLFYLVFFSLGLNRHLKSFSERGTGWL